MIDYRIAIPTHRRAALLAQKTLAELVRMGVDLRRVMLFLSDDQDAVDYAPLLRRHGLAACITRALSLTQKFNTIHEHYELGTPVVVLEDDIELIEPLVAGKNGTRPLVDFDGLVARGFGALTGGEGLWGIAPHSNAFYMTGKVTRTLKLVVAHCFGFVATGHPELHVTQPSKTDYERTLRYFVRYGEVIRVDSVGVKTQSYTQDGGMQTEFTRDARALAEQAACDYLVHRWPHLIEHNAAKKSLFAELKFKRCNMGRDELRSYQRALDAMRGLT